MRRGLAGLLLLAFAASASAQSRDVRVEAVPPAVRGTAEIFVQLGHRDAVYGIAISADGRVVASGDDTIRLWDVATGQELRALPSPGSGGVSLAFTPDGGTLGVAGSSGDFTLWDASTSTQQALEGYRGHGLLTYAIAEGLRGKADRNGDGFVSTLELAAYVDEQVPLLAERVFKRAQYPMVSPSGQGFPLAKVR